ncbi:MAG: histidinol-phosphatase [Candidatus Zixiibacteriota bacterium]|nr:MAG: histidinol-phosphatase [candidate division Zixibacteria bacterium]
MIELYEKVGAMHIHTVFSDGTGHHGEIIRAGVEAGLEFLLFSDHRTLEPKRRGREGFQDGVLVGIGYEINDHDNHNHLLAFELDREVEWGLPAVEYTRRVVEAGGWAVVAHPDERRHFLAEFPPYPWTAWASEDFQAMEIWNQLSEWMERLNRWNKLWRYLNPRRTSLSPTRWTLEVWDRLNLKRRVVGTGGVDAHAHFYPLVANIGVKIFPYKVHFRSILTHVLLTEPPVKDDAPAALKQLFAAMRAGRIFISNRFVGEARSFRFWAEDIRTGAVHLPGDRVPAGSELQFVIKTPLPGDQAVLVKDSRLVWKRRESAIPYHSGSPGVYRVEVRRRGRAFIYSNPIVIEGE